MKVILKLGGSLITFKTRPRTPRRRVIRRIMDEVKEAWETCNLRLAIVHGGGSYGHYAAMKEMKEHGCLLNSSVPPVAWCMQELNNIIMEELLSRGLPAVSFPPHAFCSWNDSSFSFECHLDCMLEALRAGSVPVTFGDIVYSRESSKPVIISGDDLVLLLARRFRPDLIVFGMDVSGFLEMKSSGREVVVKKLRASDIPKLIERIGRSPAGVYDVTDGIRGKLLKIKKYVEEVGNPPTIVLTSGLTPRNILRLLKGEEVHGTYITP